MGALIAVVILAGRTLAPLSQLANALTRVNLQAPYNTINNLMKKPKDRDDSDNPLSRPILKGILNSKCNFSYPDPMSQSSDLSFKINSGERVAILGKMGSGKSALLDFYQTLNLMWVLF